MTLALYQLLAYYTHYSHTHTHSGSPTHKYTYTHTHTYTFHSQRKLMGVLSLSGPIAATGGVYLV